MPATATGAQDPGATVAGAQGKDRFGVRMLYPTTSNGREWYLPDNATSSSNEWNVERTLVTQVEPGVFHTLGDNGEVRLSVGSPAGHSWWRNVEMTGYFRYTAAHDSAGQERHWELLARGERHASGNFRPTSINAGIAAPSGTRTWPGYPFSANSLTAACLGTAYHGNFYTNGHGLFEKEISHTNGYSSQRAESAAPRFQDPMQRWFGLKFVVRDAEDAKRVQLELWLDANADGNWSRLTQTEDAAGKWAANDASLDGCSDAPFFYQRSQLLDWAGPWVIFRSDSMAIDFRWLSVREIDAL
jgi:hypothetical protein